MCALTVSYCILCFPINQDDNACPYSIRRRALDLVYAMCDTSSVKDTVQELLNFLDTSDSAMREEVRNDEKLSWLNS